MWILILLSLVSCELSTQAEAGRFQGPQAELATLRNTAMFGDSLVAKGEAISSLALSENPEADGVLADIQAFGNAPELVRTWAVAARIQRARSIEKLAELAPLTNQYPALKRPIQTKLNELPQGSPSELLTLAVEVPALQASLTPIIAQANPKTLAQAMLTHENTQSRRLAAGLLGGMAQDRDDVGEILTVYKFDPSAKTVPWTGGALFVPALRWNREEARMLMGSLIEWHLFCDRFGLQAEQNQIYNNIRSVGLWRQAGLREFPAQDTVGLLKQWRTVVGLNGMTTLLHTQGVRYEAPYNVAAQQ